eukprot:COSAG04_NODE_3042_length_3244_cov_6.312242_4_plen_59_part_01
MPALLLQLPALALAAPRANTTALVGKAQCPSTYGPGKHTINLDMGGQRVMGPGNGMVPQ